ncbi:MAG TPA: hypothetical protein VGO89_17100, partial [Streptomyces sp.]|nr:hypothetical protein [Streptomyces sp.]
MNAPTVDSRRKGPGASDRAAASRGSRGPHGLLWLVLRTHRASLWGWAALTAAVAGGLMWVHSHGPEAERIADYGACGTGPGVEAKVPQCPDFDFMSMFDFGADVIAWLPFVVAVYAGGVLVARDLENGTGALAWTQSVTPVRWLIAKLAV